MITGKTVKKSPRTQPNVKIKIPNKMRVAIAFYTIDESVFKYVLK